MFKSCLALLLFMSVSLARASREEMAEQGQIIFNNVDILLKTALLKKNIEVVKTEISLSKNFDDVRELRKAFETDSIQVSYRMLTKKGSKLQFNYVITYIFQEGSVRNYDNEGNVVITEGKNSILIEPYRFVKFYSGRTKTLVVANSETMADVLSISVENESYIIPVE